jgi:hypothetical protein
VLIHKREQRRTFSQEGWITKDYDSRRSWIGGEGLPSRDQYSQGEERTEAVASGFQQIGAQQHGHVIQFFTVFVHMYMGFNGDRRVYTEFS